MKTLLVIGAALALLGVMMWAIDNVERRADCDVAARQGKTC